MKTKATKAKAHKVTMIPGKGFEVVSGSSGERYFVVPLASGGSSCQCAYARHSSKIASECSHVAAVNAYAQARMRDDRPLTCDEASAFADSIVLDGGDQ